jgi:putative SOS response-associated peptidase YedK
MCGRYATTRSSTDLAALFEALDQSGGALAARYNVAPTDPVPVVLRPGSGPGAGQRILAVARWGFLPHWAKDPRAGARMINARAETVATSPGYSRAFASRRALVPADGWYEWRRLPGGGRQAYFLTPADGSVLAMAGVWSRWGAGPAAPPRPPDRGQRPATPVGGRVLTVAVITTAATGELAAVHDRMPLLIPPAGWERWLSGDPELVGPDRSGLAGLELRPVGPAVGNVRNDGPELITRIDVERAVEGTVPTLF